MEFALRIAATLSLILAIAVVLGCRRFLLGTTLHGAWTWSVLAVALWGLSWLATVLVPLVEAAVADQLWHLAAVVSLCPAVAVLGARQPGSRIWTWFVVVPLVLVLGLPALTAWDGWFRVSPLRLETPVLLGYCLVLIMGAGNYMATRYAIPAILFATSLLILVASASALIAVTQDNRWEWRAWASVALGLAALAAAWQSRRTRQCRLPLDRVWVDFRDLFGIVWARRVQDRVNEAARNQKLAVRLELHGLVPAGEQIDHEALQEAARKIEPTLRWLLRRFVEPDWIDLRLREWDKESTRGPLGRG